MQRGQGGSSLPAYRIFAYPGPDGTTLQSGRFSSRDQLLQCLRTALPDFHLQLLHEDHEASVIFAERMELTSDQLSILGLLP